MKTVYMGHCKDDGDLLEELMAKADHVDEMSLLDLLFIEEMLSQKQAEKAA